ncbi:hypothetical protein Tco_1167326 [Tanacetum coccineum]
MKRHRKKAYEVLRGRAPHIIYFHVFGWQVNIHNYIDHLGKFNEKANDGFFSWLLTCGKSFQGLQHQKKRNGRNLHVTFSEDEEPISQSSTEGDAIDFNEVSSFPDDEFLEPKHRDT